MAKPAKHAALPMLSVRERLLLFRAGAGIDYEAAGLTAEIATAMIVKGLVQHDSGSRLSLTDGGRVAPRRLLPEL